MFLFQGAQGFERPNGQTAQRCRPTCNAPLPRRDTTSSLWAGVSCDFYTYIHACSNRARAHALSSYPTLLRPLCLGDGLIALRTGWRLSQYIMITPKFSVLHEDGVRQRRWASFRLRGRTARAGVPPAASEAGEDL